MASQYWYMRPDGTKSPMFSSATDRDAARAAEGSAGSVSTSTVPPPPDYSKTRQQFADLLTQSTAAYNKLMEAGKANDAYALADAMRRIQAGGVETGVSTWARQQAIQDLRNRLAASAAQTQTGLTTTALDKQTGILGNIADIDRAQYEGWLGQSAAARSEQEMRNRLALERERLAALNRQSQQQSTASNMQPTGPQKPVFTLIGNQSKTAAAPTVYNAWNTYNPFKRTGALEAGAKWGWTAGLPAKGS